MIHARIILVTPHSPGNIGAIARVMKNMGLDDLCLVAPVANLKDPSLLQMATHGADVFERAHIVASLDDALADCTLVLATSGKIGGLFRQQNVVTPEIAMRHAVESMSQGSRVAIMFGPEPTGLSNEEITRAHYLIHIPTAEEYPALNLAQAVAICLYELRVAWEARGPAPVVDERADVAMQEAMFEQLRLALEEIHFLYGDKADSLMHALRHLLGRANLSVGEVKILHGLARQLRWFAKL